MSTDDSLGYDELPYPCSPYPQTHPDHLATLAGLLGLEVPVLATARVLEIGCGDGANLLPLTESLPGAQVLGIDLSARQVAAGQATIHALGLKNARLRVQDLRDVDEQDGQFDFIIAHGVYSWTPPDVRDELIALYRRCLSPLGVGLISYNTLPGWSDRLAIRAWLLETIGPTRQGTARVSEARRLMLKLMQILDGDRTPRSVRLRQELSRLAQWSDGYLRHDLLEDYNQPVHFRDFAGHLAEHGLQFLAEADFPTMVGHGLEVQTAIGAQRVAGSATEREQLFDLLTNREFRQSLVVHQERQIATAIDPQIVRRLHVGSPLKPESPSEGTARLQTFRVESGFALEISEPFIAACLTQLSRLWPAWISFQELVDNVRRVFEGRSGQRFPQLEFEGLCQRLATMLVAGFAERAVELHTTTAPFTLHPSSKPRASPLARWQAKNSAMVTNLRHDVVQLSPATCSLLPLLDGTRDLQTLAVQTPQCDAALARLARSALLLN